MDSIKPDVINVISSMSDTNNYLQVSYHMERSWVYFFFTICVLIPNAEGRRKLDNPEKRPLVLK